MFKYRQDRIPPQFPHYFASIAYGYPEDADFVKMNAAYMGSTLVHTIPSAVADIFRFEPGGPNRAPEGNALLKQTRDTIRRLTAPSKSKTPVERGQLRILLMVELGTRKTLDVRDMCMLEFMFIGWFRESEATAL